jgi:hypothetical protein
MGKVRCGATLSLDGFMSGRDGDIDALYMLTWRPCSRARCFRMKLGRLGPW